jgi:hypothetical protein
MQVYLLSEILIIRLFSICCPQIPARQNELYVACNQNKKKKILSGSNPYARGCVNAILKIAEVDA